MPMNIKLPPEMIAELKIRQRELHDFLTEFDKLEDCGEDCQAVRQLHQQAADKIEKLLKHYQ